MKSITVKDKKIFDMNNPNIWISSTYSEIADKLKDIPVVINLVHDNVPQDDKSIVIGVITKVTKAVNNEFFGTIFLYDEQYKDYEFLNYEVAVKSEAYPNMEFKNVFKIKNILCVEFAKIK